MNFFHDHTKRFFSRSSLLILLLLMNCCAALAQSKDPLPDSVKTAEDEEITYSDSVQADTLKTDVAAIPDTVSLRNVPDSTSRLLKKSKDFEYANDDAYLAKDPEKHEKGFWDYFFQLVSSKGAKFFLYALMAAVLLFAFYKIIVDNKLYLFYSKPKRMAAVETNEVEISEDIIDDKIEEALASQDYRLAVRYMHLKVLHLLDKGQLIKYHAQGTNYEYASQLKGSNLSKDFQYLTNVYDHVWFGGFGLNQQQVSIVQQNFNHFYSEIQH
ncbi:MAG TPA: hypothetical protein VKT28_22800 [Puia sp.]|nr:hypothetical protein [Puia sp.]